jgi:hypothetical protein
MHYNIKFNAKFPIATEFIPLGMDPPIAPSTAPASILIRY